MLWVAGGAVITVNWGENGSRLCLRQRDKDNAHYRQSPTPIAATREMDSPANAIPMTIATTGLTYEKLVASTGRKRRSTMV